MEGIKVIIETCTGCGLCLRACPYQAIELREKKAWITDKCILCGACVEVCPWKAIVIAGWKPLPKEDLSRYRGICVVAEHRFGKLSPVVPEIVGAALALKGQFKSAPRFVSALLIGTGVKTLVEDLFAYGVDEVWLLDKSGIDPFAEDILAELAVRAIRERKPEIVLGGGTVMGRSLLPRIAAKLRTGLTADCTELTIDPETELLRQTRPAFGGNIMATILCESSRPQMATVRHKVMKPASKEMGRTGRIVELDYKVPKSDFEILEFVEDTSQKIDLTEADFIVSGGRGLGDPKNFSYIEELARVIGGTVGASRAAVDAGWIPYPHQVGQTGKTVNPKIYIACGISGAVQHQVGMKGSDVIIAINKDPNAPIFTIAHYGIVGDLFQVIPELIRQIRSRESGEGAS
ncbi:MAG: electron transfer flavoprotein subunit alpha [Spirochaetes bacterium]|nr:electron transfer flavoprotein subunit alpha [Spirochaetota bacterium]